MPKAFKAHVDEYPKEYEKGDLYYGDEYLSGDVNIYDEFEYGKYEKFDEEIDELYNEVFSNDRIWDNGWEGTVLKNKNKSDDEKTDQYEYPSKEIPF